MKQIKINNRMFGQSLETYGEML